MTCERQLRVRSNIIMINKKLFKIVLVILSIISLSSSLFAQSDEGKKDIQGGQYSIRWTSEIEL